MDAVITSDFVSIDGHDTLAKLFRARAQDWSDRIAMREKDYGIWRAYTWADYERFAYDCAGGFMSLGLKPGDVVSILSENNKEWAFVDMGAHAAALTINGVYPTYQEGQLRHLLNDSQTRVLIVENEEQLDKYLSVRDDVSSVLRVYVIDWKGLRGFSDPMVEPIENLYERGAVYRKANPDAIDKAIDSGKNDDTAVLIYTSGTTGAPKGALIPDRYLLFQMSAAPDTFPITGDDDILTYLPLCHAAERLISLCMNLGHGTRINFAESSETVFENIRELSPTVLFAVPRIWEKFYSRINTLMSEATWVGKKGYEIALGVGRKRAEYLLQNRRVPPLLEAQFKIADRLVFRNLKQLLGLDRSTFLLSGAAPISSDLLRWFFALGLPVAEVYGQTETGLAAITNSDEPNPGTIGFAVPGVELKLSDQNEILMRGPSMFSGYLNNPEATQSALVDGWIHTGDVGRIDDDGAWRITDRLKDIIITAGGKNITPSQVENELKFSPYISDAVVVGDKRKYLTCLIMIDQENVENFAQTHNIPFTDYRSLCAHPEIIGLIEAEIDRANKKFSSVEQVKKFRLINVLLTAEDDEMTPTMKLKRKFVETKYESLISEMY